MHADVLGNRLLDVARAQLVGAYDVALSSTEAGGWIASRLDVHRVGFPHPPGRHPLRAPRDWADFEPLIGHQPSARMRAPFGTLRRLKPAQIADLLGSAERHEQTEILDQVHADPELEADVFEELDDDEQSRILASRSNSLSMMFWRRSSPKTGGDATIRLRTTRPHPAIKPRSPNAGDCRLTIRQRQSIFMRSSRWA